MILIPSHTRCHLLLQNYEAEISAVLFWSYLASVFTIPPYLSLFMWIVARTETGLTPNGQ